MSMKLSARLALVAGAAMLSACSTLGGGGDYGVSDYSLVRVHRVQVGDGSLSIRLAGEFHLALARMSENALLAHYLGEIVSRCSLILALYGRPHSSECAVSEHREILAALGKGDADTAMALMESHISSVEDRALLTAGKSPGPQLSSILSKYTGPVAARSSRPSPDPRPAATRPGARKAATATRGK